MEIHSKFPTLAGNKRKFFSFIVFSLVILIAGTIFLKLIASKNNLPLEESLFPKKDLILLNENTLLSRSNLPNPEPKVSKKITVIVTAYSSTPWETWGNPFLTASETWVRDGIIANNLLPFGTQVRIPEIYGDKIFIVEDRMNSRKGNYHFDIWFPSYYEAKEFGAKTTYIEVLES